MAVSLFISRRVMRQASAGAFRGEQWVKSTQWCTSVGEQWSFRASELGGLVPVTPSAGRLGRSCGPRVRVGGRFRTRQGRMGCGVRGGTWDAGATR